jgi:RNA polymerase sigma-70 factor (ECF subfamily)
MSDSTANSIRACLNGHPEAFKILVRRYQEPLIVHLTNRLGDREQAEDVAQESFVRAYFALENLQSPSSFYSWLLGIANRVHREQQRQRQRQRSALETAPPPAAERPAAESNDLDTALAELPEPYTQVITLRYFGGLSCHEVARQLDVPLGTVTKRLSRAYALLRTALRRTEN